MIIACVLIHQAVCVHCIMHVTRENDQIMKLNSKLAYTLFNTMIRLLTKLIVVASYVIVDAKIVVKQK